MTNRRHWPTLVGITWRGTWDEAVTYESREAVRYGGATFYLTLGPSLGQLPSEGTPWEIMTDTGAESLGEGHIIRGPNSVDLPQRSKLKFTGSAAAGAAQPEVIDNAAGSQTVVALPPPYIVTQEEVEQVIGTTIAFADVELTGAFTHTFPGSLDPFVPADHAQVALDKGGVTHLRGQVHAESGGSQVVCTLPGIFWPTNTVVSPCVRSNGTVTKVTISPAGVVTLDAPADSNTHLDGVAFPSDLAFGGVPLGKPPTDWQTYSEGVPPLLYYLGSDTRKTILVGGVYVGDPNLGDGDGFMWPRLPGEAGVFVGTVYWTAPDASPTSGGPETGDPPARATPLEVDENFWKMNLDAPEAWPTTGQVWHFVLRGRII